MKKIITALGDPILNVTLKKEKDLEIISADIQYQDGIFEILEKEPNINFLILSKLISGNLEIKKLIEKIKLINNNIQIILFLANENKELENYLYAKGVDFIFYNNQIEIKDVIQIIKTNQKDETLELKKEITKLKKLLEEKNELETKNKTANINLVNNQVEPKVKKENSIKTSRKKLFKQNKLKEKGEIICVNGTSGSGKSIFTVNLAKSINKNKILIIDFDILNNSLHTILGVKKYPEAIANKTKNNQNKIKMEELIIKINSKIDLMSGVHFLFETKYKISNSALENILNTLSQKYDVLIIDTSSEAYLDYTREIMKLCKFNIFISGTNLLEISKTKKLLNIYINTYKMPRRTFNILFNKYDFNSIDYFILKNIFSEFNIIGKLYFNSKYSLIINKNKAGKLNKKLQKEYLKIYNNLIKSRKF